jgi:hypothetical protein
VHPDDVLDVVTAEVERLRAELEAYPQLGVTALELRGHELRLRFTKTLRPPAQVNLPAHVALPGGGQAIQTVVAIDLGRIERRELLLVMDCGDFDGQPPTAELRAADDTPLTDGQWPRDPDGQGVVFGFAEYGRPFFCRRGLCEYHDHPQHEDDPWDRYREGLPLHRIVLELLDDLAHRFVMGT